jgi:diguanylate cyclase (GGDEF)-like protein
MLSQFERAVRARDRAVEMRERTIEMRRRARGMFDLFAEQVPSRIDLGRQTFDALPTPAAIVGRSGRIIVTNLSWDRVFGPAAGPGGVVGAVVGSSGGPDVEAAVRKVVQGAAGVEFEAELLDRRFQVQVAPIASEPVAAVVVLMDITDQHRREQQLLFEATHDPLTGVANRASLLRDLDAALALARRYGQRVGIIYLDIDGFKAINDTYGHHAGDHILSQVAARWSQLIRAPDVLGRVGGDEFVVLVHHCAAKSHLETIARRLSDALVEPFVIDHGDTKVRLGVSAGLAEPGGDCTIEAAIAAADHAMYRTKNARPAGIPEAED